MQQLAEHGIMKQPNMQGLTDDQIEELKLVDEFSSKVFLFLNCKKKKKKKRERERDWRKSSQQISPSRGIAVLSEQRQRAAY